MCDGCGTKIVQIILFIVNFLVWITGVVLIGVGAYALVEADKYGPLFGEENTLQAAAGFCIGVGVIILIIGFCGCCGAFKKSECLLKIYFALVLLIIVLEIVAGILAFVYQGDVERILEENILEIIQEKYNGTIPDNVFTKAIDSLQEEFECCGGNATDNWADSKYSMDTGNMYPPSCCAPVNGELPDPCTTPYTEPCLEKAVSWAEGNYLMVGGVCIGLLVFEVLALIFACCLIRAAAAEEKGL